MCGIAGVLGHTDARALAAVEAMNDAQRHRGPDQDGIWQSSDTGGTGVVLGHRRLSILDLSDAGRQPMVDEPSGVALAFNGECYNYRELRAELEAAGRRFRTATDTEVVLMAYLEWGRAAIEKLRGMFALAIWDARDGELLLARDRLGIKPLYFSTQQDRLYFASELRALLATDAIPRRLDRQGLAAFLWHGFVPGPGTLVTDVTLLPPGQLLTMKPGDKPRTACYWSYPATTEGGDDAARHAGETLREAVAQHLASDVPLGIFLSGGVDSSVMAALAQQASDTPVTTFNIRFDEARYDESPYARQIAEKLGTDHREVTLSEDYFTENLDDAMGCIDQPTFDALNTYFVSRAVKEAGLTVALAGTGGDELTGGYPSFKELPRARRAAAALGWLPDRALRGLGSVASRLMAGRSGAVPPQTRWGKFADAMGTRGDTLALYQVSAGLFTRQFFANLQLAEPANMPWGLQTAVMAELAERIRNEPLTAAVSSLEVYSFLGERLLRDTDAASMATSLEVRVPLLDHVFVEALAAVPQSERFEPLGRKQLLRSMVADQLDPALFDRDKAGFELPLALWCRRLLSDRLRSTLQDINLAHAVGLNGEAVSRLWRAFDQGSPGIYWSRIWSLYVLMTWCRRHGVYV